jgi:tetratricopeptide (TPR) repeat protein
MSKEDWYRKTTWSKSDKEEFFARLKRSRTNFHKAQYLRIQASHLQAINTEEMAYHSLELLDLMLKEFPEKSELSSAYLQRAECLITLDKIEQAIDEIRNALQSEREYPNVKTTAWLEFGWTAIIYQLSYLYDEALKVLNEFNSDLIFPIDKYRWNAIHAIIDNAKGNKNVAKRFASTALEASSLVHSGFRYHPKIGLIQNPNTEIHSKLIKLSNSSE